MYRAIITTPVIHYAPPHSACVWITCQLSTHLSTAFPHLLWSYPQAFHRCRCRGASQDGCLRPVCVQTREFVYVSCLYSYSKASFAACCQPLCRHQKGCLCEDCCLCGQANDRRGCREVDKRAFSHGFVNSIVFCFSML